MKSLAERTAAQRPNLAATAALSIAPLAVGVIAAFLLQAVLAPAIGPFYAKLVLDVGIAILLSVSLNIVNGFAGQFSLGHGGFMLVGGYTAAYLTYYGSIAFWGSAEIHGGFMEGGDIFFMVACVVGGIVAALAGLLVGLPSLRLRGDYLAIVTLGFGEIMRVVIQRTSDVLSVADAKQKGMLGSITHVGGSLGFTDVPQYVSPTPWLEKTGHAGIFFTYIFVAICVVVAFRLKSSSNGRALLAVRENEVAAEAMGVVTARAKVTAFVMAAFFAGVAGGLFGHQSTLSPSELGFQRSIDIVIMVVLGGMGSISGAVLAAFLLTLMPEIFREFKPEWMLIYVAVIFGATVWQRFLGAKDAWKTHWRSKLIHRGIAVALAVTLQVRRDWAGEISHYRMIVYALALILIMIARPQGLFGTNEIWETNWWRRLFGRAASKTTPTSSEAP